MLHEESVDNFLHKCGIIFFRAGIFSGSSASAFKDCVVGVNFFHFFHCAEFLTFKLIGNIKTGRTRTGSPH